MVNIDVYGTDIQRDWQFTDGDLETVSEQANLGQAIINRLNTDDDWYTQFYTRYGGRLYEHFGDFNHPTIHEYIRIEVEDILSQDPRIQQVDCTVNKTTSNTVECNLKIRVIGSDEIIELNLVINENSPIHISQSELIDRRI